MVAFPVFLCTLADELNLDPAMPLATFRQAAAWLTVRVGGAPHLAMFTSSGKATAFTRSLPNDGKLYAVIELHRPLDLRRELDRLNPAVQSRAEGVGGVAPPTRRNS